ncbi:MAG: NADH-quinone oxidoreductase subunit L [candidate division WOR-3 bacterium]
MNTVDILVITTVSAPFFGFLINGIFGRKLGKLPGWIATLMLLISTLTGGYLAYQTLFGGLTVEKDLYTWMFAGDLNITVGYLLDPLAGIMLFVVTFVSLWIHLYSIGYMEHDEGYWRYFSYLNMFVFFMLVLVLGNSFPVTFVGWEGVGLASYLLIGFWYFRDAPRQAGMKAFVVNRIGDAGFLLGMFLIFALFGTLKYTEVNNFVLQNKETLASSLALAGLLFFVAATGKSAQIPLYVWLPDAMEGPTPVSALIHAATMVTAGVYLVARTSFLYSSVKDVPILFGLSSPEMVAIIGALTAFFAATMALVNNDLKRILAFSTISQLGYMFSAAGMFGYSAGVFHLYTHAFFKALLFLTAGSVMHALHDVLDIQRMGGLWKKLPWTGLFMAIGGLALAGIPPFAGFFSKDEILLATQEFPFVFWLLVITAFLTAFYMFRMFFMVFFGKPRDHHLYEHAHESPPIMLIPMGILAMGSIVAGFVGLGGEHSLWAKLFKDAFVLPEHFHISHTSLPMLLGITAGVLGILLAYFMYVLSPSIPVVMAKVFKPVYVVLYNRYWVDEIYYFVFVKGLNFISKWILFLLVDRILIDGTINALAWISYAFGSLFRKLQTGSVRTYALWLVVGALFILGILAL